MDSDTEYLKKMKNIHNTTTPKDKALDLLCLLSPCWSPPLLPEFFPTCGAISWALGIPSPPPAPSWTPLALAHRWVCPDADPEAGGTAGPGGSAAAHGRLAAGSPQTLGLPL